jgi:hypothetical protein
MYANETAIEKLARLRAEMAEAEKEIAREQQLTPTERVAEVFHKKHCHLEHTEMCGWYYEKQFGNGNPVGWTHQQYLDKAEKLLAIIPEATALQVLNVI